MKPLFRAWDGNRRLDILSIDFVNNEMETISYDIQEGEDTKMFPLENLEQYLEFDDKNGNKIFEGDIVSVERGDSFPSYNCGVVVSGGPSFYILYNKRPDKDSILLECSTIVDKEHRLIFGNLYDWPVEVIGNIHENPELVSELIEGGIICQY